MNFISNQLNRIGQQLNGLSASQKMLAGALVLVMVLTLMLWGRYAGTSEMVPVFDQSLSSDEIGRIQGFLRGQGMTSTVSSDNRVMVPSARQAEALAILTYNRMQPRDTSASFDRITAQMSPFNSSSQNKLLWNEQRQLKIQMAISSWPGVDGAVVMVDVPERRAMTPAGEPSATVMLTMRNGEKPTRQLVMAAADFVSGTVSGLKRSRVKVIADGATYPVTDPGEDGMSAGGTEILEQKQQWERHFANKIREHLSYIPSAMVTVSVNLNVKSSLETRKTVDTKNVLQKEKETSSRSEESSSGSAGAPVEPGAVPNTSLAVGSGGGGGGNNSNTTSSEEKTSFEVMPALMSEERISTPPGDATVVAASVQLPRSYFVEVWRRQRPAAQQTAEPTAEPDATQLQQTMTDALTQIRSAVKASTGLADENSVNVAVYTDTMTVLGEAAQAGSAGAITDLVGGFGRELAVGALALVSLGMVTMLARKGGGPAGAGGEAAGGATGATGAAGLAAALGGGGGGYKDPPQHLPGGDDVVGIVPAANPFLSAVELDEDTVQTQQMQEQVASMVKEDPDAAAGMIKRWMNRQ